MKKITSLGLIILVTSGFFLGWSIFEYTKQQQAYVDYFTKPSPYPAGSSVPLPDTSTFIPYLITGIIVGAVGLFVIIFNAKR